MLLTFLALSACSPAPAAPAPTAAGVADEGVAGEQAEVHRDARASPVLAPGEPSVAASPAGSELAQADLDRLRPGDVIFHTSRSAQSRAIQLATGSLYSHVGLLEAGPDGLVVLEAVEPVKRTPVREWVARGLGGHFVVKRLKDASEVLTPQATEQLRAVGARLVGKHYDAAFAWSDDRIYCSELVYKVYYEALGIAVGPLQKLRDFDLSEPAVKAKLVERYGAKIPLNETVVSPAGVFESPMLTTVLER